MNRQESGPEHTALCTSLSSLHCLGPGRRGADTYSFRQGGTLKQCSRGQNAIYKGMNSQEMALMQQMVERGYELFTQRCADGRGMTQDAIKKVGEGRVWLGQDAVKIGLVDGLGNINDAILKAAELAELGQYSLVYYPEKKNQIEELLKMFDNTTPEEQLVNQVRNFVSKPRIMALMPEVTIQ